MTKTSASAPAWIVAFIHSIREAGSLSRLLLVVKTALAVGAAWVIAPHMPGVTDDYPYYAPLGALISMYPTLVHSARSGLQTLFGAATGAALATLVVVTVGPNWWTIPAVVGLGVLLSGTGWFGVGREYVPIAALFVLIIGGQDADAYSLGYLTQMGVGVMVGLAVNLLIPPATFNAYAVGRVDAFQQQLAAHLNDIGQAVAESLPPTNEKWARDAESLADTARAVRLALGDADESNRGNPRAWRGRRNTQEVHERLDELDMIAHHIRDISGCLADTTWERSAGLALDPALVAPLSTACQAVAKVIEHPETRAGDERRVRGEAIRAVRMLLEAVDARTLEARSAMGPGVLSTMHLRRILMLALGDSAS